MWGLVSNEGWAQYAEYARRLDAVRAEELARTAGMREAVAVMSTHADQLEARLNGQGGMLGNLASTLRLRRPKLTAIPAEGFVEPSTALGDVGRLIDVGDVESRRAAERGHYPALLPTLSATWRSVAVYGTAALVILMLQLLAARPLLRSAAERAAHPNDDPSALKDLFVIPLICFAVAFVVLAVGGRSRVSQPSPTSSTRLGLVLCLGIGPLAAVLYVAGAYFVH
jgi:hypothetical protein